MANYNNLKNAIQSVIKANGNNEITGSILQTELLSMINTLGTGYQFIDVATPTTNPGTPDARVMYLAYIAGTYVNFGGIVVTGFCVLKYDTTWTKTDIQISSGGGSGKSPYIGANGNWFEWSDSENTYVDTGIRAQGPQGPQGNPGSSVDYPFELVNNFNGGTDKALTAEMGKTLFQILNSIVIDVNEPYLYFVDSNYNIGAYFDNNGFHSINNIEI